MSKIKRALWCIIRPVLAIIATVVFWFIEVRETEYWEEDHRDWEY